MKKGTKFIALLLSLAMSGSIALSACKPDEGKQEEPPITQTDKLSAPATLTYANGTLTWGAVTGATSYEVSVTLKGATTPALKQTVKTTTLDVSSLAAGEYTASVKALAEGKTTSDEKTATFTVEAALSKLATPTGFAYANGKVTWTAVEGATEGYLVSVKKKDGTAVGTEKTVTTAELDVSDLGAGEYTLSVTAKAVAGKAEASLPAAYDFTVVAKQQQLAKPAGGALDVANRKVTWTAVENAEEYEVTVLDDEGEELDKDTVEVTEYSLGGIVETATFTVKIVAKAEGYADSEVYEYQGSITATTLPAPTDVAVSDGVLTWKHAGEADHFRIVVKAGTESKLDTEYNGEAVEGVYSYDLNALATGEYTVEVYAIADEYDVFRSDSQTANASFTIATLGAYEKVENIKVEGPYITWDENNAQGYEVKVTAKDGNQALDIKGVKVVDGKFNFIATGLPAGDYTFSVAPKDERHTGDAETSTFDIALQNVVNYDAAAIAQFDGNLPRGEHGKVELVTEGSKQVAKVMPTVDGWGRIASPDFPLNYDNNPVVHIAIEEVIVGGYHLQVQIGGTNYIIVDDSTITGDTYKAFVPVLESDKEHPAGVTGVKSSFLRLGVDHSTDNALNDAETHFAGLSVWYLNEWKAPFEGKLDKPEGFEISNGMEVAWNAVENADSYNVTVTKGTETIHTKAVQNNVSLSVRDYEEGDYTITVSALNSQNAKALESDEATYQFKVEYLAEYTPEQMAQFTKIDGDETSVHYDEEKGYAIFNYEHKAGWGAFGPATGVEVNLVNHPFAYVDIEGYEAPEGQTTTWLSRSKFKGENKVIRGDTRVAADNKDDLYIEIWKDENGTPITGTGEYSFGLGYTQNTSVFAKLIRIVQITPIEELDPNAKKPLATPSGAKEEKGVLSAGFVDGNVMYTPKYAVKVTEKGGSEALYDEKTLESPSVNLALLGLTNGKTYTVTFQAIGDNGYFVDSGLYTVEVVYTEKMLIDDFTGIDLTTYAANNDQGSADGAPVYPEVTVNSDKNLQSTIKNGVWGFSFMKLDLSSIRSQIDNDYYMQCVFDQEASTAGAPVATRFIYPVTNKPVDTGYGEKSNSESFLTKEWTDKLLENNVIAFAIGHGGASAGTGETKTVVLDCIKFVKFTVTEVTAD